MPGEAGRRADRDRRRDCRREEEEAELAERRPPRRRRRLAVTPTCELLVAMRLRSRQPSTRAQTPRASDRPTAASSPRRGSSPCSLAGAAGADADRDGRGRADPLHPRRNRLVRQRRGRHRRLHDRDRRHRAAAGAADRPARLAAASSSPRALVSAAGFVAVVVLGKAGAGTVPLVGGGGDRGLRHAAGRRRPAPALAGAGRRRPSCETAFAARRGDDRGRSSSAVRCWPASSRRPPGPAAGLIAAAVLGAGGAIVFQALLAVEPGGDPRRPSATGSARCARRPCASWSSAGCRSAAPSARSTSCCPPSAPHHGASALGGPLTAALAVGSGLGGIAYGAAAGRCFGPPRAGDRQARRAADRSTFLPLTFATSVPEMFVFAVARRALHRAADHRPQQPRPGQRCRPGR